MKLKAEESPPVSSGEEEGQKLLDRTLELDTAADRQDRHPRLLSLLHVNKLLELVPEKNFLKVFRFLMVR